VVERITKRSINAQSSVTSPAKMLSIKESITMLLEEFNNLNIKQGDKLKVTFDQLLNTRVWKTKEVTQKWLVEEIKETVLSPSKTELCLYDDDGGFLPISKIKSIVRMKNSTYQGSYPNGFCFDKSIM